MSQKPQSDGGQKHFAVGRGLLAAAETLNFSMNEPRPGRQMGGMASGMGVGVGGGGGDGQDTKGQMSRHGGGGNLGSTMKLFASLGLSPSDLDALADIPEEDISVETLPQILMQLKSRKAEAGERRTASMSSDTTYRGGRDSWEEGRLGRMGGPSLGQGSSRSQSSSDFGFSSLQDLPSGRDYSLNYSGGDSGDASREKSFSGFSHQESYSGLGMGPSPSNPVFMQRRMGAPSNGKVKDFLGVTPQMFPHVCSLCDFDVHSSMEWNQHTNGLRHAENRRLLLQMYPEWDPSMSSGRSGGLLETPNLSPGLLGPAPMSLGGTGGMSSNWAAGSPGLSGKNQLGQKVMRSRVVVVKYDRKPLSNNTLFAFTKPFGCLREHLVLKNKAFLELSTHEEAVDMVNYYQRSPASLYGKPLNFYLSKRLMAIEKDDRSSIRPLDRPLDRGMDRPLNRGMDRLMDRGMDRPPRDLKVHDSKVVFFFNLPRKEEDKMELLTVAERFGVVEKHLFLTDQAFVQLGTVEDAEMLVKYYSVNPLTIKGRPIRLNICAKYKTLNVKRRPVGSGGDAQPQRSARASTSSPSDRKNSTTSRSSSSSRTREEKKKKGDGDQAGEKQAAAAKEEEEEEEEEVSGVMQGGEDGGEEEKDEDDEEKEEGSDGEGEEPEKEESAKDLGEESKAVQKEEKAGDVSEEAGGDLDGADGEAKKEQKSEAAEATASTDDPENKDEANADATEGSDVGEGDLLDQDFMKNMEDFVTLDELQEDEDEDESDAIDNTRRGGMRVVNVVGLRRGHNYLNELLGLAKPFGKVVKHLVLDLKPEAYLQFATEEEARAMAKFYNSNVKATVCGRPVRICHSMTYPTIQTGASKVVYIGQIPNSEYPDSEILKLAEPYGKIHKYFLNRFKRECFIEMAKAEDAEKMAEGYKNKPPRFSGKRLTVYVSRKYRQLKYGHRCPITPKRSKSQSPPKSPKRSEEPPAKRSKEEAEPEQKPEEEKEEEVNEEEKEMADEKSCDVKEEAEEAPVDPDVCEEKKSSDDEDKQEAQVEEMETNQNGQDEAPPPPPAEGIKPSPASLPLPAYDPDTPIGVEHVKMGYYCRVCFLFYTNEDTAKKTHCSSQAHYNKLQKYLEKEQNKAEKKKKKTT